MRRGHRISRVRVAAIIAAPLPRVREAVAALPAPLTGYVVPTGAGVLVTLEQPRRWPLPSRRRVIRRLQHQLAILRNLGTS